MGVRIRRHHSPPPALIVPAMIIRQQRATMMKQQHAAQHVTVSSIALKLHWTKTDSYNSVIIQRFWPNCVRIAPIG